MTAPFSKKSKTGFQSVQNGQDARSRIFPSAKKIAAAFLLLLAASTFAATTESKTDEELSGGATTAFDTTRDAFSLSARNLLEKHRAPFFVGHQFFSENWLAAGESASSRTGLGPLFVARACSACHERDGHGSPPDADLQTETMAVRISIPGTDEHGGPKPDPVYGLQLQTHALPGIKPEAEVLAGYHETMDHFGDGEPYYLQQPTFHVANLGYGPMSTNVAVSPLVAPALIGLGLLEAVPEKTLRRLADEDSRRSDGISGKVNLVWDVAAKKMAVGRFGWKAEQPGVRQQCASAFNGDMGLTTTLFPEENYTAAESVCTNSPGGGKPEVSGEIFDAVVLYAQMLAVPARREVTNEIVLRGQKIFQRINCAVCHVPKLETGDVPGFPELSHQVIRPYSDLLLHDMGDGLADHRQVFAASGRDWRTPPLWGIGLVGTVNEHNNFLHDGRARGLAEAILWHGGEAEKSREQFRHLNKADRDALLRFLQSL
jgi:CxxC motif-containing protein (DUF1111 family)